MRLSFLKTCREDLDLVVVLVARQGEIVESNHCLSFFEFKGCHVPFESKGEDLLQGETISGGYYPEQKLFHFVYVSREREKKRRKKGGS